MLPSVFIIFFKLSDLHISFYFSFLGLKGCSQSLDSASVFFTFCCFNCSILIMMKKETKTKIKTKTNKICLSLVVSSEF